MWHLEITAVPVIVKALDIVKKGTDKDIHKTSGSPSQLELAFAELFISLGEYYQYDWKSNAPKI